MLTGHESMIGGLSRRVSRYAAPDAAIQMLPVAARTQPIWGVHL